MSATATATAAPRRRSPLRAMTRTELRLMLREPIIFFWCIAFPALVLIILGAIRSDRRPSAHYGGASLVSVYVPILVSFAIGMVAHSSTILKCCLRKRTIRSPGWWRTVTL